MRRRIKPILIAFFSLIASLNAQELQPSTIAQTLLTSYCIDCHSGPDAEARVDIETLLSTSVSASNPLESNYSTWKTIAQLIQDGVMPPADADVPSEEEKNEFAVWFATELEKVVSKPGPIQVRRLAKHEYRNTLRSLFGFDLEVNIQEAEQTVIEKSLVLKLLPTDPPGKSGFTNDTHANGLSSYSWDQYMYLSDVSTRELFEPQRSNALSELAGEEVTADSLTPATAKKLIRNFIVKARRRDLLDEELSTIHSRLENKKGTALLSAIQLEMQAEILSPRFLFRSTLHSQPSDASSGQAKEPELFVDEFELAERLSYFLWADMPDIELMSLARSGQLRVQLETQIARMLRSPKAKSLANDFGVQWLGLDEINLQVANNPPQLDALRTQPTDFLHYLFTEERPLSELLSSNVTFVNPHTAKYYGRIVSKQLPKYRKQKGIEIENVVNSRVELSSELQRGGILTMPGILAMNRTAILRGTWLLERIMGHHLPEPPPNVPAIPPASPNTAELTFRQRFEQHRSQETCAVCHDKIDPLGFAFENFDDKGKLRKQSKTSLDTSGQLPGGERFRTAEELKRILITTEKETVIKNIVEKTLAYALCRELTVHDVPTVNRITAEMLATEATWEDLFVAIADSLPFQKYCPPAT
ncbi:MAG: DUF1592 domain-containing protein [Planctomycetota bacterium]